MNVKVAVIDGSEDAWLGVQNQCSKLHYSRNGSLAAAVPPVVYSV